MRPWWKLTLAEAKLFVREPMAIFFTLAFPLALLFVFGSIFGNEPTAELGGHGSVDLSVPGYMAMVIAITGLIGLPTAIATSRETGSVRRLRLAPVHLHTILAAWTTLYYVMTLAGAALLVVAGRLFYGLRFAGHAPSVFLAFTLSTVSFLAVGFLLAGVSPTARTANIIGMALFFPMNFLCGSTIPWSILPQGVRTVARAFPLTHVTQMLQGLWFGETWGEQWLRVLVVGGMLVAAVAATSLVFRWE